MSPILRIMFHALTHVETQNLNTVLALSKIRRG
jgi:hypothetical protein